jgi:hypothetical protein
MSLDVKFSATDAGFTSTVSKVKTSVKSMDEAVEKTASSVKSSFGDMVKAGAALAVGFGAIKVVGAAIAGTFGTFKDALDLGGTLADLADQTGETAGNLLILQRAFENSGLGADQVGTSINKIQKTLVAAAEGSDEAEKKFSKLGLTFSDLEGKSPTEQFKILADAISKLPTPAEKSAAAIEWFGKSGGKSLAFMQDFSGAVANAKDELGNMPGIMDENAKRFDDISDKINVIKGKFLEFAAGLLTSIAPALELATTLMAKFDAAGAGMKLGEILTGASKAMGGFTDALSAIKLGEFGLAFKIAFESIKLQAADSINSIAANVMAAVQAAGAFLLAAFGPGSGIFTMISAQFDILSSKFQIAMIEGVKAIATALTSMFDTPLMNVARKINPILDYQLSAIEGIAKGFDGAIGSLNKGVKNSQNKISNAVEQIGGDFVLAGQEAGKAFDSALSSSKKLIDTSEIEVKLQEHRVELHKLENEARSKSTKSAADKLTVEEQGIKIAKDRLTHEERIKELDADIASAKRKGNAEEVIALQAMKAFHLELQASKDRGLSLEESINNATKARQNIIDGVIQKDKEELEGKEKITKELQKQLGLGAQIIANANAAERKDRLDPNGRLEKGAAEAIGKGNFDAARRIGRQLESREKKRDFKEAFSADKGLNIRDIAKKQGIDTFGKREKEIKDQLMQKLENQKKEMQNRQKEMQPGAEGKKGDKPGEPAKQPEAAPENLLQKSVDAIKKAVESLEKKLPSPALGY